MSSERSSAGTAGAGVSAETGWRVKVTESMADRAAPAVVQPRLVRLGRLVHGRIAGGLAGSEILVKNPSGSLSSA